MTPLQLELLSEPDTVTCGNPCSDEFSRSLDFSTEGDETEPIFAQLIARGLVCRFECETAFHYRNTAAGDLMVRVVQSLGADGISKIP